jgi:hypothetical protein
VAPSRRRAIALVVAGCVVGALLAGCGGSSRSSSSGATTSVTTPSATSATTSSATTATSASTSTSSSAGPRYVRTTVRSGRTGAAGAIRLVGLGTLTYACERRRGVVSASLAGRVAATERVYVEGAARRHLRAGSVQPPPRFAVAGVRDRTLLWHIIQSTEGSTLDGIVALRFGDRAAARGACSPVAWRSFVGVISHVGHWTPPRGWL